MASNIWRYLRHLITPGVCAAHALRKNYYIGRTLSGPYYVCPQCVADMTARNPDNSQQFIFSRQQEMNGMKIAVK